MTTKIRVRRNDKDTHIKSLQKKVEDLTIEVIVYRELLKSMDVNPNEVVK